MNQPDDQSHTQAESPQEATVTPAHPRFDRRMLEALVCPATQAQLGYDADRQELVSRAAHLAYPIRDGIPIMLVDQAREID